MNRILALASIAIALSTVSAKSYADCNELQAQNKMMAFNKALLIYNAEAKNKFHIAGVAQKFGELNQRAAQTSAKLATKKWDEVCSGYDQLAKEFNLDVKAVSKGMITAEELRKDGGRRGGTCSLVEANKQFMETYARFDDKKVNGETTISDGQKFSAEMEPLGIKMTSNPSEVCASLINIRKKYGLEK